MIKILDLGIGGHVSVESGVLRVSNPIEKVVVDDLPHNLHPFSAGFVLKIPAHQWDETFRMDFSLTAPDGQKLVGLDGDGAASGLPDMKPPFFYMSFNTGIYLECIGEFVLRLSINDQERAKSFFVVMRKDEEEAAARFEKMMGS